MFKFLIEAEMKLKCWLEYRWFIKNKTCLSCKHFNWWMCSAGFCEAKTGCAITRMRDCMDACDCGKFKKKRRAT